MIRLEIVNDATGTTEVANYDVYLYLPESGAEARRGYVETHVRVEGFRRDRGWAELLDEAAALLRAEK